MSSVLLNVSGDLYLPDDAKIIKSDSSASSSESEGSEEKKQA